MPVDLWSFPGLSRAPTGSYRRGMPRAAPTTVNAYLAAQPPHVRAVLRQVRAAIKKALPRVSEGISYQIPTFKLDGRMVLYIAGYQKHWSIYPATPHVLDELGDQVVTRLHSKGTLRFSLDEPVPVGLVARIAKTRAAEVAAKAKRPKTRTPARVTRGRR